MNSGRPKQNKKSNTTKATKSTFSTTKRSVSSKQANSKAGAGLVKAPKRKTVLKVVAKDGRSGRTLATAKKKVPAAKTPAKKIQEQSKKVSEF